MPPGRAASRHHAKVSCLPSASIATSTPRPPVSRLIAATGSSWVKSITSSAPISRDSVSRFSIASMPMIRDAPFRRAPAVAHSPIGPWAKTATVWPIRTSAVSAAEIPVEAMSASSRHCSSVMSSGILARFACAYGTQKKSAWTPSTSCRVASRRSSPTHPRARRIGPVVVLAVEAAATRRDRTTRTRSPTSYPTTAEPSCSMTPTGSWPTIRPGATGYSPRRMCTSVPQIVVIVTRTIASVGPHSGIGRSCSMIRSAPRTPPLASSRSAGRRGVCCERSWRTCGLLSTTGRNASGLRARSRLPTRSPLQSEGVPGWVTSLAFCSQCRSSFGGGWAICLRCSLRLAAAACDRDDHVIGGAGFPRRDRQARARSSSAVSSTTSNPTPPTVTAAAVYMVRSFGQLTTK